MNTSEDRADEDPFVRACRGSLTSALRWHHLDDLWLRVRERADAGWYVYSVGEPPPQRPADAQELGVFLTEIDALLHREHDQDYCGIVYADDLEHPSLVKIYDPHHLGVSCGYSDHPPLPGWILSTIPPVDLTTPGPIPAARSRWWRRLLGG